MEKLIVVIPFTRLVVTGVLLGIGIVIGVKVGSALLRIAAPHFSKLEDKR
jgi:hypothetical protein